MKRLILIILAIAIAGPVLAEEVKYQITISVTYNAVSTERADEIIADAMRRHRDACKTEISAKKVGGVDGGEYIYFNDGSNSITLTPNEIDLNDITGTAYR